MPALRLLTCHTTGLLIALAALGTAHASVRHLPVTMTPAALLTPPVATLLTACDVGFTAALAGKTPPSNLNGAPTHFVWAGSPAVPAVTLSTPAGSMATRCASAVMDSRALEEAHRAPRGTLWVTVTGWTRTWQDAQGWEVSLSVQDAAGGELARVEPTAVAAGRAELWTKSCNQLDCTWTGQNRYGFDLTQLPPDVQALVRRAARVVIDVDCPVHDLLATQPET